MQKSRQKARLGSRSKCLERYGQTKLADLWYRRVNDSRWDKKIAVVNFALFSAIAAPEVEKQGLQTLCDWGNWVRPYTRNLACKLC